MLEIKAWVGRAMVQRPSPLGPSRPLDFASLFLSSSPRSVLPPDPSRHLPAQSGAPLCARALPVHQSTAHRGGGVPSVKSYVTVCSNPLVHGGRRASSHWLLLAPTPVVDARVHHTSGSSCCCWVLTSITVPRPAYPLHAPFLHLPPPSCGSPWFGPPFCPSASS